MALFQHRHPAGNGKIQLPYRKFVEDTLQNGQQVIFLQIQTAHRQDRASVCLFQLCSQSLCLRSIRAGTVEQDDKGFAQRFQLLHHPLFGGQVVFPGDLADGAIGGDHDADGGVIPDDLAGAGFSGKVKGDLFLEPGAFDHAGLLVLLVAHGSLHHIAHTVDEPDTAFPAALQLERHGLLRDELRLCGHDRSPCRRLRQLIPGPELCVRRADGRQHQLLHKPLDEGALAGAHRPHHANQDLPAGACPDLPADSGFQTLLFFQIALSSLPSAPGGKAAPSASASRKQSIRTGGEI